MILETLTEVTDFTRKSKLGKLVKYQRTRTVYKVQCDICGRILTRSKGETYKLEEKSKHACSPECIGKLTHTFYPREPRLARRKTGYIYLGKNRLHRLVAEEKLGRPLAKEEIVHHIDGDKGNNNPDNLYICINSKEHNRIHGQLEALAMLLVQKGSIIFNNGTYLLKE